VVVEKTANNFRGLLFYAAPGRSNCLGIGKGVPRIWGCWCPAPRNGALLTPRKEAPLPYALPCQIWSF